MTLDSITYKLYVVLFLLIILLISILVGKFLWRPLRIKKAFFQKLGINKNAVHIGTNLALAVDFTHGQIALYNWGKIRTFSYDVIVDMNHECDHFSDDLQYILLKNNRVVIMTNDPQKPEIRINFWTKSHAHRCMLSLRQLVQSQDNLINAQEAQEIIPETPEPVVHNTFPIPTTDQQPLQTDTKTDDVHVQDLLRILKSHLEDNGFSRSDGDKNKKAVKVIEAITLLTSDFKEICDCDRFRGWKKIVSKSLEPYFLSELNDPKGFGFTQKTLGNYVSKYSKF